MLGTTAKLSNWLFQVLGLWLHLNKIFLGLGVTVTEINTRKEEIKNRKIVKRCVFKEYTNKVGMIA